MRSKSKNYSRFLLILFWGIIFISPIINGYDVNIDCSTLQWIPPKEESPYVQEFEYGGEKIKVHYRVKEDEKLNVFYIEKIFIESPVDITYEYAQENLHDVVYIISVHFVASKPVDLLWQTIDTEKSMLLTEVYKPEMWTISCDTINSKVNFVLQPCDYSTCFREKLKITQDSIKAKVELDFALPIHLKKPDYVTDDSTECIFLPYHEDKH